MEAGEGWGPALTFIVRRALPLTPSLSPRGARSHDTQVVPPIAQGPLLNNTIKSLSPGGRAGGLVFPCAAKSLNLSCLGNFDPVDPLVCLECLLFLLCACV